MHLSRTATRLTTALVLCTCAGAALAADGESTLSLGLTKIFTFFFLTLGPKAVIAPFARATAGLDSKTRQRVALAATGISLLSIVVAATIGVRVLENWSISSGALLIAAGIILFLIALDSIRSQYEPPDDDRAGSEPAGSVRQLAFKLAFPYIVSPYGVAVVILVLTTRPPSVPIAPILAMLGGIMLLNLGAMLGARKLVASSYIAPALAVVGAVLGVLQAALGIQAILVGLRLAGVTG
jgi:multiple antibiotic resistance protein